MSGGTYFSDYPFSHSDSLAGANPGAPPAETVSEELPALSGSTPAPSAPSTSNTPGANYSQELYSYSLGEVESAITRTGVPGTDASGWRGFAFVAGRNFKASSMAVAIRNTGGNWLRLGLFDASGNLLEKSARFAPVSNTIVSAPLLSAVQLVGATGYYMAYWSDDSTGNLQFSCLSGRSTSNRSPLMQRNDGNENTGNISSAFAFTDLRPWMMVME